MSDGERCRVEVTVDGRPGSKVAFVRVAGEFDRLQVVAFDRSVSVLPAVLSELTVDLTKTSIIDSAALGALIRLERSIDDDCSMRVLVSEPFQVTVMEVSGLVELLHVEHV